MATILMIF